MSYQQTRSTQDPSAYPLLRSTTLPVLGTTAPAFSDIFVSDPLNPSTAPSTFEIRTYSNVVTYPVNFVITYVPPTLNEQCLIQLGNSAFGISGAVAGLVGADENVYNVRNIAGTTAQALTNIQSTVAASLPGYSITALAAGGVVTFTINSTAASGQAKLTTMLIITRAAN